MVPLTIVRPPVVLIHGIWSSEHTWDYFTPLVTVMPSGEPTSPPQYDSRFNVYRIDYSANNAAHVSQIESMAGGAFEQLTDALNNFKTAYSICGRGDILPPCIAAVQADIVAHSMGGLVARYMVLDTRFFLEQHFPTRKHSQVGHHRNAARWNTRCWKPLEPSGMRRHIGFFSWWSGRRPE